MGGWHAGTCGSLAIHTHHAMGHESGVQFRVIRETLHPPRQVSRHFVAWLAHDQIRVGDQVFWPGLLPGVRGIHQPNRKPLRCTASSNTTSNLHTTLRFCLRRIPALPPSVGRESHDSCLPLCAGGMLNIPPDHPERPALSLAVAGAPRRPMRSVGAPQARVVSPLRPAAGPRAISLTAADHPGWLDCLLVMNFLIFPASWLLLFALFVKVSGCVLSLSRVTSVSEFW